MKKAHRSGEDPRNFVLVEELDLQGREGDHTPVGSSVMRRHGSDKVEMRVLLDEENVHDAQCEWKTTGRFVLMPRDNVMIEEEVSCLSQKKKCNITLCSLLGETLVCHLSSRLCPSTAGCSPPSVSSIVVCLLLSWSSRWFHPLCGGT